jgi:hypothetical protein
MTLFSFFFKYFFPFFPFFLFFNHRSGFQGTTFPFSDKKTEYQKHGRKKKQEAAVFRFWPTLTITILTTTIYPTHYSKD